MGSYYSFFDQNKHYFFEAVVKSTFDGCAIYCFDSGEFKKLSANNAYHELTGYSKEETENYSPLLESMKEYSTVAYKELVKAVENGHSFRKEILFFLKNGEPFWADVRFEPVSVPESDSTYYVAVYHEITLQKTKEAELKKAIEEMEVSRTLKDKFLSNMSHEIRTPVTGVLGMVQLLEQTNLTDQQQEYLESIRFSARNLLSIIDDILEFNSIHSKEFDLQNKEFNPAELLNRLVKMLQHKAEEKEITLECNIEQYFPERITGDATRLNRVLMNLIGNAIKFTKEGKVTVTADSRKSKNQGYLIYEIEDTGVGIPEQMLSSIFDSFSQASKQTTNMYGGTGLGLSIVNSLVKKMGGTVEVESSEENGSRFTVTIPFQPIKGKAEGVQGIENQANHNDLSGFRILVVDDHPINRKIAIGLLGKIGAQIEEAETGEEALEKIRKNDYEVVLMDVHMPGMGGLAATREIKTNLKPDLPVLAITASIMERDVDECRAAGMDDFISKPFTLETLIQKIKEAVEKSDNYETTYDEIESSKSKASVVSIDALEELSGGDSDIIREMIQLFTDKTPGLVENLEKAFMDERFEEMCKIAHTIKPTYNYVGTDEGFNISQQIEDFSEKPFEKEKLQNLIEELKTITDQAVKELVNYKSAI